MESKICLRGALVTACLTLVCFAGTVRADTITLTAISTAFPTPIGIDHYEPTNEVVMSVNYSSGIPHNFRKVAADGTQSVFSTLSGFTNEVKIATARSVSGSFPAGTLFTGNGIDGQIVRINPDGTVHSIISLPGAGNGLMRGSLYVDRTGIYGGDLIVVTTAGEVWRVNTAGGTTKIADVGIHLEGVITVPNDVAKYGILAGKIIAGQENTGRLYIFDNGGFISSPFVGVNIEDIDLITPNENFFGVNFGTGRLLGAPAADFAGLVGDILLTQEFHGGTSGLFALSWNGVSLVVEQVTLSGGSAFAGQWEHVTFSSAGIVEIPPTDPNPIPEPATLVLFGVAAVAALRRRRKAA